MARLDDDNLRSCGMWLLVAIIVLWGYGAWWVAALLKR